jgi:hypothetical protein
MRTPLPLTAPRRALLLALSAAVATACSEPTAPPEPLVVTSSTTMIDGPFLESEGEYPVILCGFRVVVSRTGLGRPIWHTAILRFFAGVDRSAPLDSILLTPDQLEQAWPRDTMTLVRPDSSEWYLQAGVPFGAEFSFGYTPPGATAPTFVTSGASCGPVPSVAAGPPTTSLVELRTSDAELNLGDTIFVSYSANAANYLWQSGASISGPFERTLWRPDSLATVAQHTIAFVVPPLARLDLPLSVLLLADDAALVRSTSLHQTTLRVFDRTPPGIDVHAGAMQRPVGDAITFRFGAADNNALRALVWELEGEVSLRDSIVLATPVTSFTRDVEIPVLPEWAGKSARLRIRAYDDAGLASTEFVSAPALFRFHETFTAPIDSSVYPVSQPASSLVLDAARDRLYSVLPGASQIVVTDVPSMSRYGVIPITQVGPIALSRTGDTLLVASTTTRTVRVLSLATNTVLATIRLSALDSIMGPDEYSHIVPNWMAVTAAGHLLIHLSYLRGVVDVDLVSGTQRYRREFERPNGGLRAEISPDGERVALIGDECFNWFLVASDSVTPCAAPATIVGPGIRFGASLDRIGVGNRVLDRELAPVGPAGYDGQSLPDADGVHHWLVHNNRLYKVRTMDGVIQKSMALPPGENIVRWAASGPVMLSGRWGNVTRVDLTGR